MRVLIILLVSLVLESAAGAQTLQPGDTVSISVYQDPKLDRQIMIDPSGKISFPLAGRIQAEGVTPEALEKALKSRLKDKYASPPDITVALVAPAKPDEESKPRFFITGEVTRPGPYVLTKDISVMQAIAMSGGLAPFAAKSRIQVRRKVSGVESTYLFDYRAFETGQDVSGNIELEPGDVVIVPEKGLFD